MTAPAPAVRQRPPRAPLQGAAWLAARLSLALRRTRRFVRWWLGVGGALTVVALLLPVAGELPSAASGDAGADALPDTAAAASALARVRLTVSEVDTALQLARQAHVDAALSAATRAPVDVDQEHSGVVVQKMAVRKGEMQSMEPSGGNKVRISFLAPTRGLIGYHGEFLTDTRGTGVMNRLFHGYAPFKGAVESRRTGVLIAMSQGEATAYDLWNLQDRGVIMIQPGTQVYEGMIVGEHSRENDLPVNVLKGKKLTNVRASGSDEAVRLIPPRILTLEQAITYIADDELVEVTPGSIRLRKRILDPNERKRAEKAAASA